MAALPLVSKEPHMEFLSANARNVRAALAVALLALVAALASLPAQARADEKPIIPIKDPTTVLPDRASPKFEASPTTVAAVQALQDRISAFVEKSGPKYTFATSFNADTGRIEIDTDAPADLMASLTKLDDPELQREVQDAEIGESRISDVYNRRDDIQPFWGGAGLTDGAFLCSAGYAVRSAAGTVFSVTAGHCFGNGTKALVESGLRSYGTVSGRRLPTVTGGSRDMELMSGFNYVGRVYTGGVTSTTSRGVAAAGTAYVGYTNYCHSGRTTGENCGHTATSISAQVCTQTGCKSPVIQFHGGNMIQGGDSGGAFYAIDSSGRAWIRGNVIASDGTTGWATPYTQVAAQYGISIVTG